MMLGGAPIVYTIFAYILISWLAGGSREDIYIIVLGWDKMCIHFPRMGDGAPPAVKSAILGALACLNEAILFFVRARPPAACDGLAKGTPGGRWHEIKAHLGGVIGQMLMSLFAKFVATSPFHQISFRI